VYGDTDGIYMACSRFIVPELSRILGLPIGEEEGWITKPEVVMEAVEECNRVWQKQLKEFELEPEKHDAMMFVKHKNYLIFNGIDNRFEMVTKGNNFRGSEKANIARRALEEIMKEVLRENHRWKDEEEARIRVISSIKEKTREVVKNLDLSKVDIDDLTLVQSVRPAKMYQRTKNGEMTTYARRAEALERLIGQRIRSRVKFKFVVTKTPLPGIKNPSKSGVKPIDYMYPVEFIRNLNEIDLDWYKTMIENYIRGAFGIFDLSTARQTGLDAWM
jgi:hypothetical protein